MPQPSDRPQVVHPDPACPTWRGSQQSAASDAMVQTIKPASIRKAVSKPCSDACADVALNLLGASRRLHQAIGTLNIRR